MQEESKVTEKNKGCGKKWENIFGVQDSHFMWLNEKI